MRSKHSYNLSYQVCLEKLEPEKLEDMLFEVLMVPNYPIQLLLLGYIIAMICLCRMLGGGLRDIIVADLNTVLLFFRSNHLAGKQLNRIITNAFYLIPGIPMVNSVRNLLYGNEMNGILELLKVILEVLTIVAGLFIVDFLFEQWYTLNW